jgi:hypothetical protein
VYFSRSEDFNNTWMTPTNITGGSENTSWQAKPDIAYSTFNANLYVVFEKPAWISVSSKWETRNWVTQSTDYGQNWGTSVSLASAYDDGMEYHPRVSPARGNNSVLVAYTRDFDNSGDLDIGYVYTTNGGTSWSTGWTLASSSGYEDGVELSQSDSQGNFYAAFVRWTFPDQELRYTQIPTDFSSGWSAPITINRRARASFTYPKPAVCANPTKPEAKEAAIAWTDYRETWYDVYFDSASLITGFLPAVELLLLD